MKVENMDKYCIYLLYDTLFSNSCFQITDSHLLRVVLRLKRDLELRLFNVCWKHFGYEMSISIWKSEIYSLNFNYLPKRLMCLVFWYWISNSILGVPWKFMRQKFCGRNKSVRGIFDGILYPILSLSLLLPYTLIIIFWHDDVCQHSAGMTSVYYSTRNFYFFVFLHQTLLFLLGKQTFYPLNCLSSFIMESYWWEP